MDTDLAKSNGREWKQASHDLSGYWKIMNNIFYGGNFQNIIKFREKFRKVGFKPPKKPASTSELYNDMEYWRDPKDLY